MLEAALEDVEEDIRNVDDSQAYHQAFDHLYAAAKPLSDHRLRVRATGPERSGGDR